MSIHYLMPQERVLVDPDYDPNACTNCGYELISHDQWPEPFCPDGCEGLYLNADGDIVNDHGHPPTCGCPGLCNPDYYYDQGR